MTIIFLIASSIGYGPGRGRIVFEVFIDPSSFLSEQSIRATPKEVKAFCLILVAGGKHAARTARPS